jgi:glyoxylase-like metal-dependent hydrolase (beta-lactamase superfamily II)
MTPKIEPSRRIGQLGVTTVSDGTLATSLDVIIGLDQAEKERLTGTQGSEPIFLAVNCFLIELGGKRAMIDVGAGTSMGPTLGQLPRHLRGIGVTPESIDLVFLTHLHPDHSNGLIDAEANPIFPDAQLFLHEREAEFWLRREPSATDTERVRRGTSNARRATAPYRSRMRTVGDGTVLPEIAAVPLAGHTPGHTGWLIQSEGDRALIWGDIVHLASVQVPRPDAALVFDVDPEAARRTRQRVFDWVAGERLRIAGAHLGYPGFGHLVHADGGFAYRPEDHVT